jgi:hypothetical protein
MVRINTCQWGDILFSYSFSGAGEILPIMENNQFRLCSLEDIAGLKILQSMVNVNKKDSLFDEGPILTRNAVLCTPGNPPTARFVKYSPLLAPNVEFTSQKGLTIKPVKIADERNARGKTGMEIYESMIKELEKTNFFPNETQISCALKNSVEFPIKDKESFGTFVELKDFKESKLIKYAFGANIDMYTQSLKKSGIKGIRIYPLVSEIINAYKKPFIYQVIYGRDETADICLHATILFANRPLYIFGVKF